MDIKNAYIQFNDGQKVPLTKERVLIGREEGKCDVVINDASVSREHATITFADGQWSLMDLGSRNKTFVNQKAIPPNEPVGIEDGTTIHFGFYAVQFHHGKAGQQEEDPDATMAIDMDAVKAQEISSQAAFSSGRKGSPVAPKSYVAPAAGPGSQAMTATASSYATEQDPFAVLELHSVTNPKRYAIIRELTGIGTDPKQSEVVIIDSLAAPRHAEIRFLKGKRVTVKKLGQNTVKVNGRPVGEVTLKDKDEIEIGESKFTFRLKRYPEKVGAPGSSKKTALITAAVVVLLVLVVGGGYYYMNMLKPPAVEAQPKNTTVESPNDRLQDVLDLVATREYDQALAVISRLRSDGAIPEDERAKVTQWASDIQLLDEAVTAMTRTDIPTAYAKAKEIKRDTEIGHAANRELRQIDTGYTVWLNDMRRRLEESERKQEWTAALAALDQLDAHDKEGSADYRLARQRLTLKREISDVYNRGLKEVEGNPKGIEAATADVLNKIDTQVQATPELEESLRPMREKIADLQAHANLITVYNNFTGDKTALVPFQSKPSRGYELRGMVDQRLDKLNRAGTLIEEARRLMAELPQEQSPSGTFARLDEIIDKFEAIKRIESSPEFALGREADEQLQKIQTTRREEILRRVKEPIKVDATLTGTRKRLEESLQERNKWYEIIKLYPVEARRNATSPDMLVTIVRDQQLYETFRSSWANYEQSLNRVSEIVTNAAFERNQEILNLRDSIFTRIENSTFPEDTYGTNRIYNLRKTVEQITGS